MEDLLSAAVPITSGWRDFSCPIQSLTALALGRFCLGSGALRVSPDAGCHVALASFTLQKKKERPLELAHLNSGVVFFFFNPEKFCKFASLAFDCGM